MDNTLKLNKILDVNRKFLKQMIEDNNSWAEFEQWAKRIRKNSSSPFKGENGGSNPLLCT